MYQRGRGPTLTRMEELPLSTAIALWVRDYMKSRGISQSAAARFIGLTPQEMSNRLRLRTRFSLDEIGALLPALHIDLAEFVAGVEELRERARTEGLPDLVQRRPAVVHDPGPADIVLGDRSSNEAE